MSGKTARAENGKPSRPQQLEQLPPIWEHLLKEVQQMQNALRLLPELYEILLKVRSTLNSRAYKRCAGRVNKTELTNREREIHTMRSAGMKQLQIAALLGVDVSTIKSVEHRVRRKELELKRRNDKKHASKA